MSTNTPNYGLVKPTLLETADITVINSNMDTIDTQLKSVSDVANATHSRRVAKTSSTSRASTTVLADDPVLSLPVSAGEVYEFEALLLFEMPGAGTSGGYKVNINYPGSAGNLNHFFIEVPATAGGTPGTSVSYYNQGSLTGTARAVALGTSVAVLIKGLAHGISAPNAAGNITVQWAQNSSSTDATVLKAKSYLIVTGK